VNGRLPAGSIEKIGVPIGKPSSGRQHLSLRAAPIRQELKVTQITANEGRDPYCHGINGLDTWRGFTLVTIGATAALSVLHAVTR
jgi:hypothetical protein